MASRVLALALHIHEIIMADQALGAYGRSRSQSVVHKGILSPVCISSYHIIQDIGGQDSSLISKAPDFLLIFPV